ncbi:MAG: LicD family protein [Lentilactobacillus buchneri]|nr:LicD family protein [Lentilactobacillus buchneri]MCI1950498.1 LicD family protein [Lentilactobacillus buchneri]MCI2018347.1 LicD family protein [Lentilactobacillus buchneri]MCI2028622.1 LicD family protein [Lentilactobacillus buchneri]
MSDILTQTIHQIELGIFNRFVQIATKHHLHYVATGGTLLGAIRHHGFIPWDDDMDIAMLRDDYQRFLEIAPKEFKNDHYFLQTPWSDHNFALSYAKILDQNTFIEEHNNINNARKGVFLDIFPLDKIPTSDAKRRRQMIDIKRLDSRIYLKLRYNIIDNPIRKFYGALSTEQIDTANDFKKARENMMTAYNDRVNLDQVKNLASQYAYEKEIFSLEQLQETEIVPFEDTQIIVPSDYDAILKQMYGDYLKLPPENHRSEKHIIKLIYNNQEFER